mgnify:FL=1
MAWTSSDDVGNPTIYRLPNRATVVAVVEEYMGGGLELSDG